MNSREYTGKETLCVVGFLAKVEFSAQSKNKNSLWLVLF